eukprot:scaffold1698_cov279-Chaetoceros_neogracile.AAC.9
MMKLKTSKENFHYCYSIDFDSILGKGAFSTVYDAKSLKDEDPTKPKNPVFAIKCIPKGSLTHDDKLAIIGEATILQSLDHPNIIKLVDFFEEPNSYFFVTEKVEGGELFDRIVEKEYYNEKTARDAMRALLNAVEYMHGKSIVHSDLKPENLLLVSRDNDAVLKLADFGFATTCDDHANDGYGDLTRQCGTPSYVAPEVLFRHDYGTKVDMWSIGVIFYILLSGYPPFIEDTQPELFQKIIKADYEFDEESWDHISPEAKCLVNSLLEVHPKKRFSAREALNSECMNKEDRDLEGADLTFSTISNLKRFNAKRKLKAAVHSLIAINRLQLLYSNGTILSKK